MTAQLRQRAIELVDQLPQEMLGEVVGILESLRLKAEAGILREDDRLELIKGEIIRMSSIDPRHAAYVKWLNKLFSRKLGDGLRPAGERSRFNWSSRPGAARQYLGTLTGRKITAAPRRFLCNRTSPARGYLFASGNSRYDRCLRPGCESCPLLRSGNCRSLAGRS